MKEQLVHCQCGGAAKIKHNDLYVWVECKRCGRTSDDYNLFLQEEGRRLAIDDWNFKMRRQP